MNPSTAIDPDTRAINAPHYAQIVADLIDKPYCLRPWEIARLTDRQIWEYYYRPRDEKTGEAKPLPADSEATIAEETPEQIKAKWFGICRTLLSGGQKFANFSEADVQRKWDEWQAAQRGKCE